MTEANDFPSKTNSLLQIGRLLRYCLNCFEVFKNISEFSSAKLFHILELVLREIICLPWIYESSEMCHQLDLENRALGNINSSPSLYCRYIDDMFVICDLDTLRKLKDEMTVISGLNFTFDETVDQQIPIPERDDWEDWECDQDEGISQTNRCDDVSQWWRRMSRSVQTICSARIPLPW